MWEIWPSAPERTGWWPAGHGVVRRWVKISHFSHGSMGAIYIIYIYILLDIYILCGAVRIWANFEGLGMIDYDMPSWDVWDQIHVPSWDWNIYSEHTKDCLANLWSATGPQAGRCFQRSYEGCPENVMNLQKCGCFILLPTVRHLWVSWPWPTQLFGYGSRHWNPAFFSQKLLANGYPSSSSHSNDPRLLEVFNGIHIPFKILAGAGLCAVLQVWWHQARDHGRLAMINKRVGRGNSGNVF